MKTRNAFNRIFAILGISILLFHGCEIFDPSIDIIDLYGTWNMEKVSVDIDVEGDNLAQVLAFRSLAGLAKGTLNRELNNQLDSLGATMTFNQDNTFQITLFDESDTGTYILDEEEEALLLTADTLSLDVLNVERLNNRTLILSWISEQETLEMSDTSDAELQIQVIIEAVLGRQ